MEKKLMVPVIIDLRNPNVVQRCLSETFPSELMYTIFGLG